jgi:hypothetical protein
MDLDYLDDYPLNHAIDNFALARQFVGSELYELYEFALDSLPDSSSKTRKTFKQWWTTHGYEWTDDLRQVMITYRDIGHDWQFTNEQKKLLQQYYDANLLLIQCLNSDCCYVSRHVRQSIEDTLLLPYEKLKIENVE